MLLEGLQNLKEKFNYLIRNEPVTFQLVAQCLTQLHAAGA
jgi:hypothetical protein